MNKCTQNTQIMIKSISTYQIYILYSFQKRKLKINLANYQDLHNKLHYLSLSVLHIALNPSELGLRFSYLIARTIQNKNTLTKEQAGSFCQDYRVVGQHVFRLHSTVGVSDRDQSPGGSEPLYCILSTVRPPGCCNSHMFHSVVTNC